MERAVACAHIFRFGLFEADVAHNTLTRNGVRVKIQDQPFRVLTLLLERPGEIVTREELRQKLWPEGTFVDFDGSLNVILKKLRAAVDDNSDNPRFIETVPRRGYRFIAPVAVEGAKAEAPAGLSVESPPQHALPEPAGPRRNPLIFISVSAVVVLIALGAVWFARHRKETAARAPAMHSEAAVPLRETLAVLGFQNVSGRAEDAWLATAFSEMLRTELAGGEKLRLVSGEDVANLRLSAPWSQSSSLDQETTSRLGAELNSELLVLGSYTTVGNADHRQLRLDVRLQDAKTGEVLTEVAETGGTQDLFQVVSRVGAKLRDRLGVPRLEETDEAGVLAALPLDPEAARFYALGIAKLRQFDASAAKDLLEQAVKVDPKFSLGHAMLARAWSQLGYEQKRREETRKALDLSTDLPRAERMLVEGDYYESMANHEQAASIYHALFDLFPDSVQYGLQLATTQVQAGHPSQAAETIRELRRLPPPGSDDPLIDLTEAKTLSNKPAELLLIRSALTKASNQGKKLVYAQARRDECVSLTYGDHPQQAKASCEEAYDMFMAVGNRMTAADSLRLMADEQNTEGHPEDAIATYQRALSILLELGEHEKTGAVLNNMAIVFTNMGKTDRAEQLYLQARNHFEQAGDKYNTCTVLGNIADLLYLRGDLPGAERMYQQTITAEGVLDHGDPSYALYRLGDLELAEGQPEAARHHAEQAITLTTPAQGGYQYLTAAMLVRGEALEAEGDLKGARKQFEEALGIRQKMGEVDLIFEAQVTIAEVDLAEGRPEQAEPLLRDAIAEFEKEKEDPDTSSTYAIWSRALLMEGKLDEAKRAVDRATELSRTISDPALLIPVAIQNARVEMASAGHGAAANLMASIRQQLLSAERLASKSGYYGLECEARLALGELETKTNPVPARDELNALAAETRKRGLGLLAQRAEQAVTDSGVTVAKNPAR
jgi:DNA-binding winged helix-turn-helix (wHTH) protein/tetratricopeptide (TPR) repeat protein/TolB-like protein